MNDDQIRQTNSMKRSKQFVLDHPITPANAAVTTASTALTAAITQIEALDSARLIGTNLSRGAVAERQLRKKALRSALSDLSRVSKTLDKTAHPDVAAQLKMGGATSYAALLTLANSAVTVITPIKQVFIDHGAAATVVEDLQDLIDAFVASGERRYTGLGAQVGGTAALKDAIRAGMDQVRVLDGILSILLKPAPGVLAEWKAAKRVERRLPEDDPEQPAPVTAPGIPLSTTTNN
jgi:hypothetical protein